MYINRIIYIIYVYCILNESVIEFLRFFLHTFVCHVADFLSPPLAL